MAVIIPNTYVNIDIVRSVLNYPSYDVGRLIVAARTGGIPGTGIDGSRYTSAFQTRETGAYLGDMGLRVENAFPCWNIWANNQPGEWVPPNTENRVLRHRLKQDSGGPLLTLDFFAGHNMDAPAPGINDVYKFFTQGQNSGIIKDYAIAVHAHLGEYEWSRVSDSITHWQVRVMDGNNTIARSTPTPVSTGMAIFSVVFPIIGTSAVRKDVYETRVYLGNGVNDFTDYGYIPGSGNITIDIKKAVPKYTLGVRVEGVAGSAFSIPDEYGTSANTYTFTCTYRTMYPSSSTEGKRLYKARYQRVDAFTDTVKETIEITSGFIDEGPSSLDGWTPSFNRQIFSISSRRMVPSPDASLNEQIQVTLYYE